MLAAVTPIYKKISRTTIFIPNFPSPLSEGLLYNSKLELNVQNSPDTPVEGFGRRKKLHWEGVGHMIWHGPHSVINRQGQLAGNNTLQQQLLEDLPYHRQAGTVKTMKPSIRQESYPY